MREWPKLVAAYDAKALGTILDRYDQPVSAHMEIESVAVEPTRDVNNVKLTIGGKSLLVNGPTLALYINEAVMAGRR